MRHQSIILYFVFSAVGALVSLFFILLISINTIQQTSLESAKNIAQGAMESISLRTANLTNDNSWWDEAIREALINRNDAWLSEYFGLKGMASLGVSGVIIIDASDTMVFHHIEDRPLEKDERAYIQYQIQPLLNQAKSTPLNISTAESFFLVWRDKLFSGAISAFTPVQPDTLNYTNENRGILVFLSEINARSLQQISTSFSLQNLRFIPKNKSPINTENAATRLKLYSPIGDEVGHLTWHPPSTASQLSGLLIISLTTTALLIALVYMLYRIFNKKIGKMHYELADALIKQKHLRTNLTLQSKLAGNESPDNVIEHLADVLESAIPQSRCVTYLLDNVTHRITKIAAPSLDEGFIQSLKTIRTDQDDDSLTLFNGTSWTIPSLYSDPHRKYLNQFDVSFLKSAWSESMVSEKGERFGGVIIYREVEGQPEEHYRNLVKSNIAIAASNMAFCLNNQRMEQLAYYDPVTNLVNRHLFRILLERAIQHRKRHSFSIAILHIDIDHFKHLNNTLGHDIADQILVQLADRIAGCVRQSDIVARISGDEFAILIQVERINIGLDKVAEKVLNTLRVPIEIRGKTIRVSASIGIAVDEKAQLTANELLHRSDEALRTAKESGRDQYCYYDAQLEEASQSKRLIEKELVNAISNSEFRLVYQPKIDMIKGTVNGLEALIRWRSTKLGDISPDVFIPIAEQNGQITSISDFVMEEACTKLAELQSHGFKHINMAVNLSARQFKDRELVDKLRSVIKRHRLKPSHLELELTETMIMEDKERARTTLRKLQEAGLKLAIDDFGTGYSSLSYLQYFRVDKLKVDRSFVMNIPDNSNDMELTAAIIALAHKLNLQVVAEGVETEAQSGFLNDNNCDEAQGYFFCKPIESDDLIDVLLKMEKQYPLENKISN